MELRALRELTIISDSLQLITNGYQTIIFISNLHYYCKKDPHFSTQFLTKFLVVNRVARFQNFDRIENSILRSPAEAPARAMSGCRKKGGSKASVVLRTREGGGGLQSLARA